MGCYKYGNCNLKRMVNLVRYGIPASWAVYLAVDYVYADSDRSIFRFFSPEMRPYLFVVFCVVVAGFAYAASRRMLGGPKIEGDIRIEAGRLQMTVQRGNRMEPVELDIREVTFVENDDERMLVSSPGGEYIFNSNGFVSGDDYQKFRMEMTCEKYKK